MSLNRGKTSYFIFIITNWITIYSILLLSLSFSSFSFVKSFDVKDQCDSCAGPLVRIVFGSQLGGKDVLAGTSEDSAVGGADLHLAEIRRLVDVEALDDHDGQLIL